MNKDAPKDSPKSRASTPEDQPADTRQHHSAAATGLPGDALANAVKDKDQKSETEPAPSKGAVTLINRQNQKLILNLRNAKGTETHAEIEGRGRVEWDGPENGELGPDAQAKVRRGVLQVVPRVPAPEPKEEKAAVDP